MGRGVGGGGGGGGGGEGGGGGGGKVKGSLAFDRMKGIRKQRLTAFHRLLHVRVVSYVTTARALFPYGELAVCTYIASSVQLAVCIYIYS